MSVPDASSAKNKSINQKPVVKLFYPCVSHILWSKPEWNWHGVHPTVHSLIDYTLCCFRAQMVHNLTCDFRNVAPGHFVWHNYIILTMHTILRVPARNIMFQVLILNMHEKLVKALCDAENSSVLFWFLSWWETNWHDLTSESHARTIIALDDRFFHAYPHLSPHLANHTVL